MDPEYRYAPAPVAVTVKRRLHRFGARVVDHRGRTRLVHVPNPGRMAELLRPGAEGWMVPSDDPGRRTVGTLVALRHRRTLVSIDTQLPNRLFGRRLATPGGCGSLGVPEGAWRPEVRFGASRIDFGILGRSRERPLALLEVKSANLRVGEVALFPDAPTLRGARHVRELAVAARSGIPAAVVFVVQRGDVRAVGPHRAMDPDFGEACDSALRDGVRFTAVRLRVRPTGAALGPPLPVEGLAKAPQISM